MGKNQFSIDKFIGEFELSATCRIITSVDECQYSIVSSPLKCVSLKDLMNNVNIVVPIHNIVPIDLNPDVLMITSFRIDTCHETISILLESTADMSNIIVIPNALSISNIDIDVNMHVPTETSQITIQGLWIINDDKFNFTLVRNGYHLYMNTTNADGNETFIHRLHEELLSTLTNSSLNKINMPVDMECPDAKYIARFNKLAGEDTFTTKMVVPGLGECNLSLITDKLIGAPGVTLGLEIRNVILSKLFSWFLDVDISSLPVLGVLQVTEGLVMISSAAHPFSLLSPNITDIDIPCTNPGLTMLVNTQIADLDIRLLLNIDEGGYKFDVITSDELTATDVLKEMLSHTGNVEQPLGIDIFNVLNISLKNIVYDKETTWLGIIVDDKGPVSIIPGVIDMHDIKGRVGNIINSSSCALRSSNSSSHSSIEHSQGSCISVHLYGVVHMGHLEIPLKIRKMSGVSVFEVTSSPPIDDNNLNIDGCLISIDKSTPRCLSLIELLNATDKDMPIPNMLPNNLDPDLLMIRSFNIDAYEKVVTMSLTAASNEHTITFVLDLVSLTEVSVDINIYVPTKSSTFKIYGIWIINGAEFNTTLMKNEASIDLYATSLNGVNNFINTFVDTLSSKLANSPWKDLKFPIGMTSTKAKIRAKIDESNLGFEFVATVSTPRIGECSLSMTAEKWANNNTELTLTLTTPEIRLSELLNSFMEVDISDLPVIGNLLIPECLVIMSSAVHPYSLISSSIHDIQSIPSLTHGLTLLMNTRIAKEETKAMFKVTEGIFYFDVLSGEPTAGDVLKEMLSHIGTVEQPFGIDIISVLDVPLKSIVYDPETTWLGIIVEHQGPIPSIPGVISMETIKVRIGYTINTSNCSQYSGKTSTMSNSSSGSDQGSCIDVDIDGILRLDDLEIPLQIRKIAGLPVFTVNSPHIGLNNSNIDGCLISIAKSTPRCLSLIELLNAANEAIPISDMLPNNLDPDLLVIRSFNIDTHQEVVSISLSAASNEHKITFVPDVLSLTDVSVDINIYLPTKSSTFKIYGIWIVNGAEFNATLVKNEAGIDLYATSLNGVNNFINTFVDTLSSKLANSPWKDLKFPIGMTSTKAKICAKIDESNLGFEFVATVSTPRIGECSLSMTAEKWANNNTELTLTLTTPEIRLSELLNSFMEVDISDLPVIGNLLIPECLVIMSSAVHPYSLISSSIHDIQSIPSLTHGLTLLMNTRIAKEETKAMFKVTEGIFYFDVLSGEPTAGGVLKEMLSHIGTVEQPFGIDIISVLDVPLKSIVYDPETTWLGIIVEHQGPIPSIPGVISMETIKVRIGYTINTSNCSQYSGKTSTMSNSSSGSDQGSCIDVDIDGILRLDDLEIPLQIRKIAGLPVFTVNSPHIGVNNSNIDGCLISIAKSTPRCLSLIELLNAANEAIPISDMLPNNLDPDLLVIRSFNIDTHQEVVSISLSAASNEHKITFVPDVLSLTDVSVDINIYLPTKSFHL